MNRKRHILLKTTSQDLNSAALNYSTDFDRDFKLLGVYFHFSASVTAEDVVVSKNSNEGANYDTVLDTTSHTGTDLVFRPTGEEVFKKGDEVTVTCTTAAAVVYVSIYVEEI